MALNRGVLIEAEEVGQLALFGLLLIPATFWVAKSKSGTSMAVRGAFAIAALAGVAILEGTLDQNVNKATEQGR